MTLARRIRLILDGDTSAMFARGGGGAKSSKGGKGSKSKKTKGATQAGSGGACCKAEGGKFAPGNNYGSLAGKGNSQRAAATRVKQRLAAKSREATLKKAAEDTAKRPTPAGVKGIAARSKAATVAAARVQAAKDRAALEKKQAKNAKVREKRAAKKEAAKTDRVEKRTPVVNRMVAKSKVASDKGAASVSAKVRAEAKAAGYGPAEARQIGLAAGARAKADAAREKTKRGTPERMAQVERAKQDRDWNRGNRANTMTMKEAEAARSLAGQAKAARGRAIGSMVAKSKDAASAKAKASEGANAPGGLEVGKFNYSRGKYRLTVNGEEVRPGGMLLSFDKKRDAVAFQQKLNAVGNWKNLEKFTDAQKKQAGAIMRDIDANKSMAALMNRGAADAAEARVRQAANEQAFKAREKQAGDEAKVRAAEDAENTRLEGIIRERAKAARAKEGRAASLKRLTDKSRVASGKAGAENAARKREAAAKAEAKPKATKEERAKASAAKKESAAQAQRDARRQEREQRQQARDLGSKDRGTARRAFDAKVAAGGPATVVDAKRSAEINRERKARNAEIRAKVKAAAQREKAARAVASRPVTPVAPPPASVESRPISDPARLKAESAKMDEAFAKAPGGKDNFVTLDALHKTMPHLSRDEFIKVVEKGQDDGKYGLETHEGLSRPLTRSEKDASIVTTHGRDTIGEPIRRRWAWIQRIDR